MVPVFVSERIVKESDHYPSRIIIAVDWGKVLPHRNDMKH